MASNQNHYNLGEANGFYRHGLSRSPEYRVWAAMKDRCLNENNPRWHRYGGRGITVCKRWLEFENFITDMGRRPAPGLTLERKRNNQGYKPSNCVWATPRQQSANRINSRYVPIGGEIVCASEAARRVGLTINTFNYRLRKGQL